MTVYSHVEIEDRDRRLVEMVLKENFTMLKDIYHHVQGRSLEYPVVTADAVYRHMFQHL